MRDRWSARLAGRLRIIVRDGGSERVIEGPNLILQAASGLVARALAGDAGAVFASVAIGTSGTSPTPADPGPLGDAVQVPLSSVTHPDEGQTEIIFRLEEGEGNELGSVAEFVLLAADGTAFARTVRGPITKNSNVQIEGTWTISGVLLDGGA